MLPRSTVAIGSTTLVLAQSLSGAVFLAVADAIFQSQLRKILSETSLSSTTVDRVLGAGALGFRNFIHDRDLDTVSQSYNTALTRVFVSITENPDIEIPLINTMSSMCRWQADLRLGSPRGALNGLKLRRMQRKALSTPRNKAAASSKH